MENKDVQVVYCHNKHALKDTSKDINNILM